MEVKRYSFGNATLEINDKNRISLEISEYFKANSIFSYWDDKFGIRHYFYDCKIVDLKDELGTDKAKGEFRKVTLVGQASIEKCNWEFKLYNDSVELRLTVLSDNMSINRICPLYSREFEYSDNGDVRVLMVPYDNDKWDRFKSLPYSQSELSYGLTSIYDEDSRKGLVVGAVCHDTWKNGVLIKKHFDNEEIELVSGVADDNTRDYGVPHGSVTGEEISSDKFVIIPTNDWRYGLIKYGKLCENYHPRLGWDSDLIVGWNSWSAYLMDIDFEKYTSASYCMAELDFIKEYSDGKVYINFDANWSNLSDEELKKAVDIVKNNGQVPGIYFAPLVGWGGLKNMENPILDETGEKIKIDGYKDLIWSDLLLRDKSGNIRHEIAGGYPLDVTHPVLLKKIETEISRAAELGFGYAKIDFLAHGAVEGEYINKEIQTGVQAYNYIMSFISKLCKKYNIFLSLSIAPLFPSGYGNGRRICCDVFGEIKDSEYGLNSLTYGFWENGTLYDFSDPDHICCREGDLEAKMRFVSSAISGTMMIWSDKTEDKLSVDRAKKWYGNHGLMQVAKLHKAFMPINSVIGSGASDMFMLTDGNVTYVALFNFSEEIKQFSISNDRIDIKTDSCICIDVLENTKFGYKGEFSLELNAYDCRLFKIEIVN